MDGAGLTLCVRVKQQKMEKRKIGIFSKTE